MTLPPDDPFEISNYSRSHARLRRGNSPVSPFLLAAVVVLTLIALVFALPYQPPKNTLNISAFSDAASMGPSPLITPHSPTTAPSTSPTSAP
jgi:hypothetical protein